MWKSATLRQSGRGTLGVVGDELHLMALQVGNDLSAELGIADAWHLH